MQLSMVLVLAQMAMCFTSGEIPLVLTPQILIYGFLAWDIGLLCCVASIGAIKLGASTYVHDALVADPVCEWIA